MKVFSIIIHNFNLVSSKFACHLRPQFLVHMYTFPFFVFIQKKIPWEEDLPIHHPQPTGKSAEVKFKEPGANINSSRFKIYRRQSLTIPNTERKNSPPLLLGGAFFFEKFWWCSTGWVTDGLRLSFGRMFLCGCWCWVVWVLCFGFGKGWSTIGCEFDVPKKGVFLQKKTEEGTESSQIFHLKKDE